MIDTTELARGPSGRTEKAKVTMLIVLLVFGLLLPVFSLAGVVSVELVNMFGRYMAFAIVAIGLDLIWGYCGILSLAQSFFFALGGYAIGFYLTFQGNLFNGIPEALYVVYPYEVGQSRGTEVLPWFWVPFRRFVPAVVLGLAIPAGFAALIGYVGFRSRVKGVYELRVVIGPNGAGKTTMCDVISGKTRPTTGKVFYDTAEITSLSETGIAARGIGRKFQTPSVYDSLTVFENMELAVPGRKDSYRALTFRRTDAERQRIMSVLHRVHLYDDRDTKAKRLSHGHGSGWRSAAR